MHIWIKLTCTWIKLLKIPFKPLCKSKRGCNMFVKIKKCFKVPCRFLLNEMVRKYKASSLYFKKLKVTKIGSTESQFQIMKSFKLGIYPVNFPSYTFRCEALALHHHHGLQFPPFAGLDLLNESCEGFEPDRDAWAWTRSLNAEAPESWSDRSRIGSPRRRFWLSPERKRWRCRWRYYNEFE